MKIVIYGEGEKAEQLTKYTLESLESLGLSEFVTVEQTEDPQYKEELGIESSPAFCIEEQNLEFKDMIFQGEVPPQDEITRLVTSIIGGSQDSSCSSNCANCSSGCFS